MAVDPHAPANELTTSTSSCGPAPSPPTSAGSVSPNNPDSRSAATAPAGKLAAASLSWAESRATASTGSSRSVRFTLGRPFSFLGRLFPPCGADRHQANRQTEQKRERGAVAGKPVRRTTELDQLDGPGDSET